MAFETGELHPNTPHLFADLAELLLLTGRFGRARLHKNDLEGLLTHGAITVDEIDEEEAAEEEAEATEISTAERSGRVEKQLEDIFTHLAYRAEALVGPYPFVVEKERLVLVDGLTPQQRVYRFLVCCSRLRSFQKKGVPQRWAKHFARISKVAMQGLAPATAETRIFDANSDDRKDYYSTDLRVALKKMGEDLGVLKVLQEECDKQDPAGDAGFDLVTTVGFNDGAATNYGILGQCGARETEWPSKTLEAHAIRASCYFQLMFQYPSVMFTPVCFRSATGEWVDNRAATGILLADRGRMLSLIDAQTGWDPIVQSEWFTGFETEFNEVIAAD